MCCLTPALHVYNNISNIAWANIGDDYDDDKLMMTVMVVVVVAQ